MPGSFDYSQLEKHTVACPICAADSFEPLCHTDRYLMGLQTVRCNGCGLILTNPVPTPEALDHFYHHHYRQYYRKLDRPDISYIHRYALDRRAVHTADYLASVDLIGPERRVLDVGCGEGSILREIACRHPQADLVGAELDDEFREFANTYVGRNIYPSLRALPANVTQPFDTVILSHVLEHVPDPVAFLRELADHLTPNGRLFVDVPDVCGYRWLADLHIAHIFHFSSRTLLRAAHAAGLNVACLRHHKPPKLPACLSMLLTKSGEDVALPDTIAEDEAAAAERIRRFGRRAWLFNKCFSASMYIYETTWNLTRRSSAKHRLEPVAPQQTP
jgi:2-polyprenyl-3-methyl-5-hydroxy-6-metoxy-1,4-benzoquinol methylase